MRRQFAGLVVVALSVSCQGIVIDEHGTGAVESGLDPSLSTM
jgi:hypothetical protein